MSSQLQIDAHRNNGANSRPVTVDGKVKSRANLALGAGPVTPEGKARAAQNALRHGILAESVVLTSESREAFNEILATLEEELHPDSPIECRYVETMALAFRAITGQSPVAETDQSIRGSLRPSAQPRARRAPCPACRKAPRSGESGSRM